MKSKSVRRPSPALIVAIVALVAALAGSAIALPGKNSVKKNDIAKNAVVSKAIKNDKVTGADVNEASLGPVPSAASAAALAGHTRFRTVIGEGTEQPIATFGPFTLVGTCAIDDSGDDFSELYVKTSVDNAAMDSNSEDEETDFDTSLTPLVLVSDTVSTGDPEIEGEYGGNLVTHAPDGHEYSVDDLTLTINMPNEIAKCGFAGSIEQIS
jgi:hypothetical protein